MLDRRVSGPLSASVRPVSVSRPAWAWVWGTAQPVSVLHPASVSVPKEWTAVAR